MSIAHFGAGEPDAPLFTLPDGCTPGDAARIYQQAGLAPVLLHSVEAGLCSCKNGKACRKPGKHPRRVAWTTAPTEKSIANDWQTAPKSNVGLQMGGALRLVTIDVDGAKGAASLVALEHELGELPRTLTSRTGSGGQHRVFFVPEGLDLGAIKNTAGVVAPGIDIRAQGGQIAAAPSMHASGQRYAWTDTSKPAALPDAWYERIAVLGQEQGSQGGVGAPPSPASKQASRSSGKGRPSEDERRRMYAQAALERAAGELHDAGAGQRNATLNAKAYLLGRFVGNGWLTRGEVEAVLIEAAHACGLDKGEIAATLRSGLERGIASPRDPELPPDEPPVSSSRGTRGPSPTGPAKARAPAGDTQAPADESEAGDNQGEGEPPPVALGDRRQGERRRPAVFRCTDTGNAERLIAHHGADLRYCHPWQKWLVWNGNYWRADDKGGVRLRAKNTVRVIYQEAANVTAKKPGDEASEQEAADVRKALAGWAKKSESAGARAAMVTLAQSEPGIPVVPEELDSDHWLFNVKNGTIDLRTGQLQAHDPSQLITKLAPVVYDPAASCPTWLAFLDTVMAGDAELVSFLQRFVGYCLTGETREHVLVSCYGTGSNGKSTFLETILDMMGPYGWQAPPDLLMQKQNDAHPTDMASLFGVRFATCIETASGRRLDEARMKSLTGGDRVTARRMREDFWSFAPTHKLALGTNHKPVIGTTDHGTWRRQKLVPFTVTVADGKQDKHLPKKLRAELSGILRWAVEGCMAWQSEGLGTPARVRDATAGWRDDSDPLGDFLGACCELGQGFQVKARDLYAAYSAHCEAAGEEPLKQKGPFGGRLTERGLTTGKSNGARLWRGLRLLTPVEQRERAEGEARGAKANPASAGSAGSAGSSGSSGSSISRFNSPFSFSRETNRRIDDPDGPDDPAAKEEPASSEPTDDPGEATI